MSARPTMEGLLDAAARGDVDHYIAERRCKGPDEVYSPGERLLADLHSRGLVLRGDFREGPTKAEEAMTDTSVRERITHAAIRVKGETWALPAPARHHHLIHAWSEAHSKPGRRAYCKHESGFLTSAGRYVGREEAKSIAEAAGQLLSIPGRSQQLPELYSEDVW